MYYECLKNLIMYNKERNLKKYYQSHIQMK